jgi:hypothetical protein
MDQPEQPKEPQKSERPRRAVLVPADSGRTIQTTTLTDSKDSADLVLISEGLFDKRSGARFADRALLFQFIYSIVGLVLGLASMVIGGLLCLSGVTGHSTWSAKILGSGTELSDAAPGTLLFVVGLFFAIVTRYKVKVKPDSKP